jgi:hypothetical protein
MAGGGGTAATIILTSSSGREMTAASRFLGLVLTGFTVGVAGCRPTVPRLEHPIAGVRSVELRFVYSPYADYLFYLLYRDTARAPGLEAVPLDSVPTLNTLVALPEIVASQRVTSYDQILPLAELFRGVRTRIVGAPAPRILTYGLEPANYDSLRAIVAAGKAAYPTFAGIWRSQMEPAELRNIAVWQTQGAACHPMDSLQVLTRLVFPSPTIDVGAVYMHFSGSGNYTPMGVYSRTFDKPNLAFTLGHEAMHLLVNPMTGHDWRKYSAAARTLRLARAVGLKTDDLDELLALFMQVKLPQACGTTSASRRISDAFRSDSVRYKVLVSLEDGWSEYRANPSRWPTIIDYFLDRSTAALSSGHLARPVS